MRMNLGLGEAGFGRRAPFRPMHPMTGGRTLNTSIWGGRQGALTRARPNVGYFGKHAPFVPKHVEGAMHDSIGHHMV